MLVDDCRLRPDQHDAAAEVDVETRFKVFDRWRCAVDTEIRSSIFVLHDGGISGSADSFSGMRDVMLYRSEGDFASAGLLDSQLVLLGLHTHTNGVLVGGDNSKMSVLEKLARLALKTSAPRLQLELHLAPRAAG